MMPAPGVTSRINQWRHRTPMSLLAELKRRNVIRVGLAYLVLGWVLIQVTDIVAPALMLPEWGWLSTMGVRHLRGWHLGRAWGIILLRDAGWQQQSGWASGGRART